MGLRPTRKLLDNEELIDWGFSEEELQVFESREGGETAEDEPYTTKIEAPIYEPKGEKPKHDELFDDSREQELIKAINASDLPKKDKEFLIKASQRHTVFSYEKIADFYAHSEKEVQELMEDSALIIIDFEKAIENGYVKLSDELSEQYQNENPDE